MLTYKTSEDFKKMERAGKVVSNIHYEANVLSATLLITVLDVATYKKFSSQNIEP